MTSDKVERIARQLLAEECRKDGLDKVARDIELGMHASHFADIALRAVEAALLHTGAGHD